MTDTPKPFSHRTDWRKLHFYRPIAEHEKRSIRESHWMNKAVYVADREKQCQIADEVYLEEMVAAASSGAGSAVKAPRAAIKFAVLQAPYPDFCSFRLVSNTRHRWRSPPGFRRLWIRRRRERPVAAGSETRRRPRDLPARPNSRRQRSLTTFAGAAARGVNAVSQLRPHRRLGHVLGRRFPPWAAKSQ